MYVGLYVAANRDREQFAENEYHDSGIGFFGRLSLWLKRLFQPARKA